MTKHYLKNDDFGATATEVDPAFEGTRVHFKYLATPMCPKTESTKIQVVFPKNDLSVFSISFGSTFPSNVQQ